MKKYIVLLSLSLGIVLILIQSVFFTRTASTAGSKPNQPTQKLARLSAQTTVQAVGQGNPLINLHGGRDLLTSYLGSSNAQHTLEQNLARPTVLASADFDEDGTADLIAGYAGPLGGLLTLHRGNVDAIYPNSPEAKQRKAEGSFTESPFLAPALVLELPEAPDFVATGDFDADGHWDLAMAANASNSLYLLSGDGHGNFSSPKPFDLPGRVTALASGEINRADGLTDIAIALVAEQGAQVLVFEGPQGALRSDPEAFRLPAPATGLALGRLTEDYLFDLAAAAGPALLVVEGRDRKLSLDAAAQSDVPQAVIKQQSLPFSVRSMSVGNFDGGPGEELALLTDDGTLHLLAQPSRLLKNLSASEESDIWSAPAKRSGDGALDSLELFKARQSKAESRSACLRTPNCVFQQPAGEEGAENLAGWSTKRLSTVVRPGASQLITARVSSTGGDDLVIGDSANNQLHIITNEIGQQGLTAEVLNVAGGATAVLPMRLNADALSDMVILRSNQAAPAVVASPQGQATFTVTNTDDRGAGSLRDAITLANQTPGADLIDFRIGPGGAQTIIPLSALPIITGPVTIDGTTQPGFAGTPIIELNGSSVPNGSNGLLITGGNTTVRGLVINRFGGSGDAIEFQTNGGNIVEGNFIGTNLSGNAALNNGTGVFINGPPNNRIGGTTVAARNLISSNGRGIFISRISGINTTGNLVQGNFIGTDAAGTADLGNTSTGVFLFGAVTTIGGTVAGARNIISGNGGGIGFDTTSGTLVQGNFIGTDVTGTVDLGNSQMGVQVTTASPNNTFGGTTPAARNIVSGNTIHGFQIRQTGTNGNVVQGNFIGTQINGTSALGNGGVGVSVENLANNNIVGGTASGAGNIVAFNNDDGVDIVGGTGNAVLSNSIFSNSGLGIDLSANGVTPNDSGDADSGPNNLQNFPVLTSAISGGNTVVQGTLNSTAQTTFTIQFFSNSACDASGNGEGQNFLGSTSVTTNADGNGSFSAGVDASLTASQVVTATATDLNNNTSEFSACRQVVQSGFSISGRIADGSGQSLPGVTVTVSGGASGSTTTDPNGNYSFSSLAAGGNYTVTPSSSTYSFSPASRTFNNLNVNRIANFVGTQTVVTIAGRITDAQNNGIGNAIVALSGSQSGTTATDAAGNYSFSGLSAGGNYIVTPSGGNFSPSSQQFNNLSVNAAANFILIATVACTPPPTGMVAWYPGDGNANDIQGGNNGTLQNGATFAAGMVGQAFSLDGVDDQIFIGNPTSLRITGDLTIGAWVNPVDVTEGQLASIVTKWGFDGTTDSYGLWLTKQGGVIKLFSALGDAAGSGDSGFAGGTLAPNTWMHVAMTYQASNGLHTLYVNGQQVAQRTRTGGIRNTNTNVLIGREDSPQSRPFNGRVDEADIYNRTLPQAEIQGIVNAGSAGKCKLSAATSSISGRLTNGVTGLTGATVTLSGTLSRVVQTDANGNYTFANLTAGGNYTVTVQSSYFVFAPSRADFFNLSGNQTANFIVTPAVVPSPSPPLSDDFSTPVRDADKWSLGTATQPAGSFDPQVTVSQVNQQLVITPVSQVSGLHYNGYVSANSFDLRGGSVSVELVTAATGGADTIFAIGSDSDNFYRFMVRTAGPGTSLALTAKGRDGIERPLDTTVAQLLFQVNVGGQLTALSIPYDPVQHRFMRFRHDAPANAIVFETSPNNIDFTERQRVVLVRSVSALTAELSAGTSNPANPGPAVFDNFGLVTSTFQFSSASYTVDEGGGSILITVTRAGSTAAAAAVDYATADGTALQTTRYIIAAGRLMFAPGEASKTFRVLIVDNAQAEGDQNLNLLLQEPAASGLSAPGRAVLTIIDNDTTVPTANPLDAPTFFVTQHYYDFLNRVPDADGLAFWVDQITSCGSDTQCIELRRINVSAAYFLSIEFQETGLFVIRAQRAAFGRKSDTAASRFMYQAFIRDARKVGDGVIVGQPGFEQKLEDNKQAYATEVATSAAYITRFPLSQTAAEYVDALFASAMVTPPVAERDAAIAAFGGGGTAGRVAALRSVADSISVRQAEFNAAFVLMQYYGYLRRNPTDAPDGNDNGYQFWLTKLNQFNGNFVNAEMVKAFIVSGEYRQRFGP